MREERIEHLESLLPCEESVLEAKHRERFEIEVQYMGNGIYRWMNIYSTDTQELWLMGVLQREGVSFKEEGDYEEDDCE